MVTSISQILDALPLKQNGIVLDVNFGSSRSVKQIAEKIPDGQVIAIDLSSAREKKLPPNVKYLNCSPDNGKDLPLRDSFCDVVILSHTLRYIVYRESFLKECKRVLKPGGLILVVESQTDSFGVPVHPDMRIIFDDMLEYLDRSGFLLGENFDTSHHEYGIIGVCPLHSDE